MGLLWLHAVLGYTLAGRQLALLDIFPSALAMPSIMPHISSPVRVQAEAEMEGVRVTEVTFPQEKEAKLGSL